MDIKKIIKEHHQAMIDKGFYDCPETKEKPVFFQREIVPSGKRRF